MKKKFYIPALLALLLLCCVGCGKTEPVSESAVTEAVKNMDSLLAQGMTVNSVTIDEQKTDVDNKTDQILVTVEASNEDTACTAKYELNYYLYDQGWALESAFEHNLHEWVYKPLKAVATNVRDEKVSSLYGNRILSLDNCKEDLENGVCVYTYTEKTQLPHCIRNCVIEVRYAYDFSTGAWKFDSNEELETSMTDWDITGTWNAVAASSSWITAGWSEGMVVTVKSLEANTANISVSHPETGTFFDGAIPFDPNTGIHYYIDELAVNSPYSFTIVISDSYAELVGTGMLVDEDLVRQ